jgi:hypothetical protein
MLGYPLRKLWWAGLPPLRSVMKIIDGRSFRVARSRGARPLLSPTSFVKKKMNLPSKPHGDRMK